MKIKSFLTVLMAIIFVVTLFSSCSKENSSEQSLLHMSPVMCKYMLDGVTPEEFYESNGKNTFLENRYLQSEVDEDGCLILTLKNEVVSEWKNTFRDLQILQCVFGDTRDIGITVDYSKDFMNYMKNAHTCGYEISEDFTQIIESPEDNSWYYPFVNAACATMQVFEGKTCSEIKVEHIEIDENGEIIEKVVFPSDIKD